MSVKEFHQEIIKGLIQTTVNRTHLDFERRRLIEADSVVVNWTNLRSLTQEIDFLYDHEVNSRRERTTLDNLITEIRARAPTIYPILANERAFERSIRTGIKVYSQHIKRINRVPPPGFSGFYQTLEDQIQWETLAVHQRRFTINNRVRRYLDYKQDIENVISHFFRNNGANPTFDYQFRAAQQDCCWCLFNYRQAPLYRTVLRHFIEDVYFEADQELQRQGLQIDITRLIGEFETYINQQCTYLHFNLEHNSATLIQTVFRKRRRTMTTINTTQL